VEEPNQAVQISIPKDLSEVSALAQKAQDLAMDHGPKLLMAIGILVVGVLVAKILRAGIRKMLGLKHVPPIVASFVTNIAYIGMLAFVVIAAMQAIGIATTSFIAVLGAAGLAVGLALQGSLSNFAAGFMLVIFRPFKLGDFVDAGGTTGVVEEIQVFSTILKTPDNKKVIVPNSSITGGNIINFSAHDKRRVDWVFGVSYSDDIDKVKATIRRVVEADKRVHKDPAVFIVLSALADSSVNFTVRAWANSTDYWGLFFDINEAMKKAFDADDITIPFPQRDLRVFQETK
jgi:small conductance mechanosensitive channel